MQELFTPEQNFLSKCIYTAELPLYLLFVMTIKSIINGLTCGAIENHLSILV